MADKLDKLDKMLDGSTRPGGSSAYYLRLRQDKREEYLTLVARAADRRRNGDRIDFYVLAKEVTAHFGVRISGPSIQSHVKMHEEGRPIPGETPKGK